jgi:hypothetical protein
MLRINPAFFRHPKDAAIIGRMVVAFGELEYLISVLSAWTNERQPNDILRVLYRINATSSRIAAADSLLRPFCLSLNLIEEYEIAYSALWWCLSTRNRYAHCNWADHPSSEDGLFFVDLQSAAAEESGFEHDWRHVDVPLLQQQESFFEYTQDWLQYLDGELAVRSGKKKVHPYPRPSVREPPPAHNPPSQHIPQWISEALKARHLERAAQEESGAPRPTRKQVDQDNRRQEKHAKREADRQRDLAKHSKKGD